MTQKSHVSTESTMATLAEIGHAFGRIPNLFQAYAKHPPLLEANWRKVKLILLNGVLPRLSKEIIALLVSHDNGCAYCIAAHSAALKSMGVKGRQLKSMIQGDLSALPSERDIELVEFARNANQRHHSIGDGDLERLYSLGYTEADIIEALGIVELFAGFNRFAKAMRIEIDF